MVFLCEIFNVKGDSCRLLLLLTVVSAARYEQDASPTPVLGGCRAGGLQGAF